MKLQKLHQLQRVPKPEPYIWFLQGLPVATLQRFSPRARETLPPAPSRPSLQLNVCLGSGLLCTPSRAKQRHFSQTVAAMQVFARCAGRDSVQILLADPWETIWSVKQRLLERHGAPGAFADMVRPGCFPHACQPPCECLYASVLKLVWV